MTCRLFGVCQAIIWTKAGMLLILPFGTNHSEILIENQTFCWKNACESVVCKNGSHFVSASICYGAGASKWYWVYYGAWAQWRPYRTYGDRYIKSIGILNPQLRRLNKTLTTKKTSTSRIIGPLLGKTTGFQVMTSSLKQMSKHAALVVDCRS